MVADDNKSIDMPAMPAGSYDTAKLGAALEKAVGIGDPVKREAAVSKALAELNETATDATGLAPGEKLVDRVTTFFPGTEQEFSITESIRVSDPDLLKKQIKAGDVDPDAPSGLVPPPAPADAAASK